MTLSASQSIRLWIFLVIFSLISFNLVLSFGFLRGMLLTFLTWSFYCLCTPLSNSALITSKFLDLFTNVSLRYAKFIPWLFAIVLNIFIYLIAPYVYIMSATTFLLYRIISNPWPYWLIIVACALVGLYNSLFVYDRRFLLRHAFARTVLFAVGVVTFFYLSYVELVLFFCASTY
jgi:hypothetical protein